MTREIVSLTPLPVYAIQGARVRYGSKPVRGANAASFEPLLGAWARDRGSIYFEGRRVGRAQRESFRTLEDDVGCDRKRIFYKSSSGDLLDLAYDDDDGFDLEH